MKNLKERANGLAKHNLFLRMINLKEIMVLSNVSPFLKKRIEKMGNLKEC